MTFTGEAWSITLGTWFGTIPVDLHCTSVLPLLFQVILAQAQYNDVKYSGLIFCLYGPILLVTIFFSGFVEASLCYIYGRKSTRVLLWPLGGFPLSEGADGDVLQDFWVASIGTSAYIPQLFLWFTLMTLISPRGSTFFKDDFDIDEFEDGGITLWFATLGRQAILFDLVLIIFNALVPAFPFGGSYCVTACMVRFGYTVSRAANVVGYTGATSGIAMIVYGGIRVGASNDLQVIGMCMVGTFVLLTSGVLIYMNDTGRIHQHPLFCRECYKVDMDDSSDTGSTPPGRRYIDHCPERGYQFDAMSSGADSLSADENVRASRVAKDEKKNSSTSKKASKHSPPNPKGSSAARIAPSFNATSSTSQQEQSETRIPKNANNEAKRMPQKTVLPDPPDPPGSSPGRGRPPNQEPIVTGDSPTASDRKGREVRSSDNRSPRNSPLKRDVPVIDQQSPLTTPSSHRRKQEDVQSKLPVLPFLTPPPERDSPPRFPQRHVMSPSNRTPSRKKRSSSLSPHLIELPHKELLSPWTAPSSPIPTHEKVEMQGVDRLRNKASSLQPASAQQMSPTPSHSGRQKPTVKRHTSLDITTRDRFQAKFQSPQRRHTSRQKQTILRDLVEPTISPRKNSTLPAPPLEMPYSPNRASPNQPYSPQKIARSPSQIRRNPFSLSPHLIELPHKEFQSPWTTPSSPIPTHEKVEMQGVGRLRNKASSPQPASAQQMSPTPSHSGRQKPTFNRHASLSVTPRDRFQAKLQSQQRRQSTSFQKPTTLRDLVQPTISPRKNSTIPGPPSDIAPNQPYSPQEIARSPSQIRRHRRSLYEANSAKGGKSPPEVRSCADKPGKGRDPPPHSTDKCVPDPSGKISASLKDSLFPLPLTRAPSERRTNVRRSDPKKKKKVTLVEPFERFITNEASELTAES
jgi:hypothetical protein